MSPSVCLRCGESELRVTWGPSTISIVRCIDEEMFRFAQRRMAWKCGRIKVLWHGRLAILMYPASRWKHLTRREREDGK